MIPVKVLEYNFEMSRDVYDALCQKLIRSKDPKDHVLLSYISGGYCLNVSSQVPPGRCRVQNFNTGEIFREFEVLE